MKRAETTQQKRRDGEKDERGECETDHGEVQDYREPACPGFGIASTTCPGFDGEATKCLDDGKPEPAAGQQDIGHGPQFRCRHDEAPHGLVERRSLTQVGGDALQRRTKS